MKVHRWRDIRNADGKLGEEQLAEIDKAVAEEAHSYRALREALGLTQAEVANLVGTTQGEVSRFEQREDHRISRLRELVEAVGGELKVIAVVGGKEFRVG